MYLKEIRNVVIGNYNVKENLISKNFQNKMLSKLILKSVFLMINI